MIKFNWLKWLLYFVIALLTFEVLKVLIMKIEFSANYLVAIIFVCLQNLVFFGFFYYALFANIFKKKLKRRKLLAGFSISFVCLVALFELLFTYWLYHPASIPAGLKSSYKYYYEVYNFRIIQYEKKIISFNTELLYTLKPNTEIDFKNVEFNTRLRINKYGFRDDDASAMGPEIICLGDSFTMGWGLDDSASFPEILQRKTGKKVLNTGTPSYGTARELLLMERLDTSKLKYIIIQYCSNDKDENVSFISNHNKLDLTPLPLFKSYIRSYEFGRKYFPGKNFLLTSQVWMKKQFNKVYPLFRLSGQPYSEDFDSHEHAFTFFKVLQKFREKYKNVKIIVTNVDVNKYRGNTFIDELKRQADSAPTDETKNIIFVNSIKDLTDDDYFILDHHINSSGHQKVAEKLLEAIRMNP